MTIFTAFLFIPRGVWANASANGKLLQVPANQSYSFLMAGHLYGFPGGVSQYPASTFLANLNKLEKLKFSFVALLGDTVRVANERSFDLLHQSVLGKISAPVFIVPGNHDYPDPELYEDYFGETYYSFRVGTEQFVFLNSEPEAATSSSQLTFINSIFSGIRSDSSIKNVVVFSSRLFWLEADPALIKLATLVNARRIKATDRQLWGVVEKELKSLEVKEVYLIAGDVGVESAPSVLSHHQENSNFHFIATGLGDDSEDAVLMGIVNEGNLRFEVISLISGEVDELENYTAQLWADLLPDPETDNGAGRQLNIFEKIWIILLRKTLWAGVLLGVVMMMGLKLIKFEL